MSKTLAELLEQEKTPRNLDGLFATLVEEIRAELEVEKNKEIADFKEELQKEIGRGKEEIQEAVNYAKSIVPEKGEQGIPGVNGVDGIRGKDGIDGRDGLDGKNGVDGKDGSPDTGKEIVVKVNELPIKPEFQIDAKHIKNLPKSTPLFGGKRLGRGTGNPAYYYEIKTPLDGVTKSFSIPSNSRVVGVHSSSAPFIFDDADWTGSGTTTLTFGDNVDASIMLAAGQTIKVFYIE